MYDVVKNNNSNIDNNNNSKKKWTKKKKKRMRFCSCNVSEIGNASLKDENN